MNYQNFDQEIHALIAERGQSYYTNGHVKELKKNGEGWTATIEGSENYRTKIVGFEEISDWHCECPFDHGPICKHVAATLYAVRDAVTKDHEASAKARTILSTLSEEELQQIVFNQLDTNRPIRDIILSLDEEE